MQLHHLPPEPQLLYYNPTHPYPDLDLPLTLDSFTNSSSITNTLTQLISVKQEKLDCDFGSGTIGEVLGDHMMLGTPPRGSLLGDHMGGIPTHIS